MSTAVKLLGAAGLLDNAKHYAAGEIKKSASPWYFMAVLGGIEQKMGNTKASLEWSQKAWNSSRGPNTRFAQGSRHLMRMMSSSPNDTKSISTAFAKVLKEIVNRERCLFRSQPGRVRALGQSRRQMGQQTGAAEFVGDCSEILQEIMSGKNARVGIWFLSQGA